MFISVHGPWLTIATLVTSVFLGACGAAGIVDDHPETPAARADSVAAAVADIVNARCELEHRCNNVGPGQKYESRDACESKMQGTTASVLNTNDCPLGVDGKKLDTCIANIRAEDCGSVFDSLTRWNACRTGQVCYK
jgi:hypothetical protein